MKNVNVRLNGFNLRIHPAALSYLGGIDPEFEWRVRGISGHDKDATLEAELQRQREQAVDFLTGTGDGQARLQGFVDECSQLLAQILGDEFSVERYLGETRLVFVIGAMRTGGTYLFSELNKALGIRTEGLSLGMVHDSIPSYSLLKRWMAPAAFIPLLFELAQFLVWVRRELAGTPVVVQKRIAYGHAIPLLDQLFGARGRYVVTVRHPVSLCASFLKLMDKDPSLYDGWTPDAWYDTAAGLFPDLTPDRWEAMGTYERALRYWERYYSDIVTGLPTGGEIVPLAYGPDIDGFISRFAGELGTDHTPSGLRVVAREYPDFLDPGELEAAFERVETRWRSFGLDFPRPDCN